MTGRTNYAQSLKSIRDTLDAAMQSGLTGLTDNESRLAMWGKFADAFWDQMKHCMSVFMQGDDSLDKVQHVNAWTILGAMFWALKEGKKRDYIDARSAFESVIEWPTDICTNAPS